MEPLAEVWEVFPQGAGRSEELAGFGGIMLSWKVGILHPGLEQRGDCHYRYLHLCLEICFERRIANGGMGFGSNWARSVLHDILLEDSILHEENGDVLMNGAGVSLLATIQVVAAAIDSLTEKIDAAQEEGVLVVMAMLAGVEAADMPSG